jgi:predicted HicB family RNase H-like nuclease
MKNLNVNVDDELHHQLKIAAAIRRLTLRAFVRVAIVNEIKAVKKGGKNEREPVPIQA